MTHYNGSDVKTSIAMFVHRQFRDFSLYFKIHLFEMMLNDGDQMLFVGSNVHNITATDVT